MKHIAPEIPLDTDLTAVSGMALEAELTVAYADVYKEQIKNYDLERLLKEVTELEIGYGRNAALGIRIIKILVDAIDDWIDRN